MDNRKREEGKAIDLSEGEEIELRLNQHRSGSQ